MTKARKSGAKQSRADRLERINHGACPVHGAGTGQVDGWYYPAGKRPFTTVGCCRKTCEIKLKSYSYDGPWEIMPEWAHLLEETEENKKL